MASPELNVRIGAIITNLEKNLKKATNDLQKFSNKSKAIGRRFESTGKSLTKGLTLPLALLAAGAINASKNLETLETSLSVMTGSAEKGKKLLKELTDFAAKTPFQLEGIGNTAKQLLAFGFSSAEVKNNLKFLGDAAAGSGNDLGSLGQIFGQVSAAGKLTGERLNQLQERAVPIGSALAKSMGVAESSIKEMVSKGKISFADFEKAFKSLSEEGGIFAGAMEKQSKTLAGVFSTLKDNVNLALGELGNEIVETFDLKQVVTDLTKYIQKIVQKFKSLDSATKKSIVKWGALLLAIGPVITAIGLFATTVLPGLITVFTFLGATVLPAIIAKFGALNTVLLANPIIGIIAGVTALTIGFISLLQELTPVVTKMQTFLNFLQSGGNYTRFMNLQLASATKALNEEYEAADKAAKAAEKLASDQFFAAEATKTLTKELLAKKKAEGGVVTPTEPVDPSKKKTKGKFAFAFKPTVEAPKFDLGLEKYTGPIENAATRAAEIAREKQQVLLDNLNQFREQANSIIQTGVADTFAGIGSAIGDALVSGGNVVKAAGGALLKGIGEIAVRLGKAAIKIGVGMLAIKMAFKNPFTAIAAGIALVALGTALGGIADKAVNGGGSSGSVSGAGRSSGGFVGARTTTSSVSSEGGGTYVFEIAGTKLVGVLKNTLDRNKAFGGNLQIG